MNQLSLTLRIIAKMFFGTDERMKVWHKLATLIRNRVSLEDAILRLQDFAIQTKSPLEVIYGHMLDVLRHGQPFDQAIKGIATPDEVMLIGSAQSSGRLYEGLMLATKVLKANSAIKKGLFSALATPVMLFIACIAMFVMIAFQVMPQLTMVSDPKEWTGAAWLLYVLSEFCGSWAGALTATVFIIALIVVFLSFPRLTGPLRRRVDKYIPWSIYRLTIGTGWLYTIATRMSAGHQLSQILASMLDGATPYLRDILEAILEHSRHGEDFGTALYGSGMNFPSAEIVGDLRIYASMPGFQTHIMDIADTWLAEGAEAVSQTAKKIATAVYFMIFGQMALVALVAGNFQNQVSTGGM